MTPPGAGRERMVSSDLSRHQFQSYAVFINFCQRSDGFHDVTSREGLNWNIILQTINICVIDCCNNEAIVSICGDQFTVSTPCLVSPACHCTLLQRRRTAWNIQHFLWYIGGSLSWVFVLCRYLNVHVHEHCTIHSLHYLNVVPFQFALHWADAISCRMRPINYLKCRIQLSSSII